MCFAECGHECCIDPTTKGVFGSVVVSRAAVDEPEDVPATQTYAVPSAQAAARLRKRVTRYRAELAHAEDDDLLDLGDGKEEITHLLCGDLGLDDDDLGEKWYARFAVNGKLYLIQRSSLDDHFLEEIMDKCRNHINKQFSLAHLKGAQCGMCYGACHAMPCLL